ncbi:MAG TPA: alanine dehydrogenase, partial [Campylobacterales bacterium]|nr:alanine dehydrogenase [Campylobacterales bacterium]
LKRVIPKGSVVIDLVGGSETNRSAVESVLSCTFLTEPHFIKEEVIEGIDSLTTGVKRALVCGPFK